MNLPQAAKEGAPGLSNLAPEAVILGCLVHPFPHKQRHRVSRAMKPGGPEQRTVIRRKNGCGSHGRVENEVVVSEAEAMSLRLAMMTMACSTEREA